MKKQHKSRVLILVCLCGFAVLIWYFGLSRVESTKDEGKVAPPASVDWNAELDALYKSQDGLDEWLVCTKQFVKNRSTPFAQLIDDGFRDGRFLSLHQVPRDQLSLDSRTGEITLVRDLQKTLVIVLSPSSAYHRVLDLGGERIASYHGTGNVVFLPSFEVDRFRKGVILAHELCHFWQKHKGMYQGSRAYEYYARELLAHSYTFGIIYSTFPEYTKTLLELTDEQIIPDQVEKLRTLLGMEQSQSVKKDEIDFHKFARQLYPIYSDLDKLLITEEAALLRAIPILEYFGNTYHYPEQRDQLLKAIELCEQVRLKHLPDTSDTWEMIIGVDPNYPHAYYGYSLMKSRELGDKISQDVKLLEKISQRASYAFSANNANYQYGRLACELLCMFGLVSKNQKAYDVGFADLLLMQTMFPEQAADMTQLIEQCKLLNPNVGRR